MPALEAQVFGPTTINIDFSATGEKTLLTMSTTLSAGGRNVIIVSYVFNAAVDAVGSGATWRIKKGATILYETKISGEKAQGGGQRAKHMMIIAVDSSPSGNDTYTFTLNLTATASVSGAFHVQGIVIKTDDAQWAYNTAAVSIGAGATATVVSLSTSYPANSKVAVLAYIYPYNTSSGQALIGAGNVKLKLDTTVISSNQFSPGSYQTAEPAHVNLGWLGTVSTSNQAWSVEVTNGSSYTFGAYAVIVTFTVTDGAFLDTASVALTSGSQVTVGNLSTTLKGNVVVIGLAAAENTGSSGVTAFNAGDVVLQLNNSSTNQISNLVGWYLEATSSHGRSGILPLFRLDTGVSNPSYQIKMTARASGINGEAKILVFLLQARWLEGWRYRRRITVTAGSNGMPANYQVKIVIDTASLISAGKMRSDGGDIRFTKFDGVTLLSYWIESGINTANTVIWVKDPDSLSAGAFHAIYMYYGNPSATSQSSGANTFDDFDDFLTNTLANYVQIDTGWSIDTTPPGYLKSPSSGNGFISKSMSLSRSYAVRARVYMSSADLGVGFIWGTAGGGESSVSGYITNYYVTTTYSYLRRYVSGGWVSLASLPTLSSGWYIMELRVTSSAVIAIRDTTQDASATDTTFSTLSGVGFRQKAASTYAVDWWALRKYVDPEPSVTIGSEETLAVQYTLSLTEPLGLFDKAVKYPSIVRRDGFGLSDTYARSWIIYRTYCESLGLLGSTLTYRLFSRSLMEVLGLLDLVTKIPLTIKTELAGLSDTITISPSSMRSETLGLADSMRRDVSTVLPDLLGLLDTLEISRLILIDLLDMLGLMDMVSRSQSAIKHDFLGLMDVFSRTWGISRTYGEAVGLADTVSEVKAFFRYLDEILGLLDVIVKSAQSIRTDRLGLLDAYSRIWTAHATYREVLNLLDTITRKASFTLLREEKLGLTDTILFPKILFSYLEEIIGLSDTLQKSTSITLQDYITLIDNLLSKIIPRITAAIRIVSQEFPRYLVEEGKTCELRSKIKRQ